MGHRDDRPVEAGVPGVSAPALSVLGASARYAQRVVLHGVDLVVSPGEWVALLGANGSGKSSLLDCCVGRLSPFAGDVRICGHSMADDPIAAKRRLGYAIAPERLPALLTVRQCLTVQAAAKRLDAIDPDVLDLADALHLGSRLDDVIDQLSYGTRQKLGVLLALVGAPDLVVMDETFNGLDPASSRILKHHLRERADQRATGVLLATHALDIATHWADRVVMLHEGHVLQTWNRRELEGLRDDRDGGLEAAMAARIALAGQAATR
jgi:ABC-2 type transport system ATP-binding protein